MTKAGLEEARAKSLVLFLLILIGVSNQPYTTMAGPIGSLEQKMIKLQGQVRYDYKAAINTVVPLLKLDLNPLSALVRLRDDIRIMITLFSQSQEEDPNFSGYYSILIKSWNVCLGLTGQLMDAITFDSFTITLRNSWRAKCTRAIFRRPMRSPLPINILENMDNPTFTVSQSANGVQIFVMYISGKPTLMFIPIVR